MMLRKPNDQRRAVIVHSLNHLTKRIVSGLSVTVVDAVVSFRSRHPPAKGPKPEERESIIAAPPHLSVETESSANLILLIACWLLRFSSPCHRPALVARSSSCLPEALRSLLQSSVTSLRSRPRFAGPFA